MRYIRLFLVFAFVAAGIGEAGAEITSVTGPASSRRTAGYYQGTFRYPERLRYRIRTARLQ